MGKFDVANKMLVQGRGRELIDRLGRVTTRGLDWDVVVLLKVDAGLLLGGVVDNTKEFTLETRVRRARNVLAIAPLAVTRAASRATAMAFIATAVAASTTTGKATAAATAGIVVGVVIGGDLGGITPVVLASAVVLVRPVAVAQSVRRGTASTSGSATRERTTGRGANTRTRTIHRGCALGGGLRRPALGTITHVRRDV
jgi:hypothetical protein